MTTSTLTALTEARAILQEHVAMLDSFCLRDLKGNPRRETLKGTEREWVERHEKVIARLDVAIAEARDV